MFLMTTTLAGITTGTLLGRASLAQGAGLGEAESARLLRMVQDIYPHPDLLQIAHYQAIVDAVVSNADDDAFAALQDGLARIEAKAQELFGVPYTDIEDPDAREGLLRHFQNEGFFQNVRWTAYFGIYNNKEIWPLFGYEGSSVEYGGYINRGFSDITFVPPGPTLEERLAEVQK
ncbi:MAG: gluconate 2-dehydrogenase subunit 3 family protein [Alphaproteobacteria bacterium]|nr:MAG: gluconate 2-dehydrogenase subunit 3 family protein [Alphaproteobacteria bacterium]